MQNESLSLYYTKRNMETTDKSESFHSRWTLSLSLLPPLFHFFNAPGEEGGGRGRGGGQFSDLKKRICFHRKKTFPFIIVHPFLKTPFHPLKQTGNHKCCKIGWSKFRCNINTILHSLTYSAYIISSVDNKSSVVCQSSLLAVIAELNYRVNLENREIICK